MVGKESLLARLSETWARFMLPDMLPRDEINRGAARGRDHALQVTATLKFRSLRLCWKTDRATLLAKV